MESRLLFIALITITLLALTACSSPAKQVSVDESSSDKQVEIAAGGSLKVTLESNQTTGYCWELKPIGDTSVLEKVDNKYEAPNTGLIGAGGKEIWNFKALKAGKSSLTMEYSQPWADGQKGVRTFNLTVVIK